MIGHSSNVGILERIFSATDVMYACLDTDFNFIRVNRAYAEADGREPDFYVGRNHFDIFPYRDNQGIFKRVVETGEAYTVKAEACVHTAHPERGVLYQDWTLHPLKGSSGKVEAVVLSVLDATERVGAITKLRETESRLSTVVESLPFDFFVLDPDGRCTFQNAASRETWGDVTGKRPQDVAMDPGTLALWERNNRRALAGETVEEDVEFSGEGVRYYHNIITPIRDGEKIIGIQGINIDITERKKAEDLVKAQRDLAIALSTSRELGGGLEKCLDAAIEVSGMDCGGIYLVDEVTGGLRLALQRGFSEEFARHVSSYEPDSPNARIVSENQPVYSQHVRLGVPIDETRRAEGLRAMAVVPFSHEGRVIGCVNVASHSADTVPASARTVLEAIVAQIGGTVAHLKAQEALRDSEELYRTLVETSPDAIVLVDVAGRVLKVSRQAALMAGFDDPEKLVGFDAAKFLPPREEEALRKRLEERVRARDTDPVRYTIVQKDGTELVVEGRSSMVTDNKGNPRAVMSIVRNVTERVRADRALRESEEIYRALVETSPDAIVMTDLQAKILRANRQAALMAGYDDVEELVGKRSFDYIAPQDREIAMGNLMATIDGRSKRALEYTLARRDGSTYPVELSASVIQNEIGEPKYLMAIMRDVTERKLGEKALKEEKARLGSIFRVAPIGIGVLVDRVFVEINDHFCDLLGYSRDELLGEGARMVYPSDEDYEYVGRERYRQIEENGIGSVETRLRRKDGRIIDVLLNSTPLDSADVSKGITFTVLDITERKRAQRELEEQRALAIASDRLRSLGEMAAGIAHELNQPLVGVRGLAEHVVLALERKWELSKEDVYQKLQKIIEQADRMAYIVDHVRMFAREADRPETRPVNVNEVLNSSLGLVSAQLRQRGLELECRLAEHVPEVEANPFTLEEVILNLVTNARDAVEERLESDSAADQVVMLRTLVDRSGSQTWVRVEVADRGVGITAEQLGRVFDPFYTTKDPDKGTGLGLAISKSIIEKLGGTIKMESEPGGGTTVTISLPAIRSR